MDSDHHHHLQNNYQQQPNYGNNRRVMKQDQENATNDQITSQQPPPAPQKCPRCDSNNTKFCYYNNYSLSQPRYFCKACRRYWTQGGNLRNVPVGGGCRKSKRPAKPSSSSSTSTTVPPRTNTQSAMAANNNSSLPPSSSAAPAFLPQSYGGLFSNQNLIRAADPLLAGGGNNSIIPSLYPSSLTAAGGFFAPFSAMVTPQPLMPSQFDDSNISPPALFQGMNFQNLKPSSGGGHEMMSGAHRPTVTSSQMQDGDHHRRTFVGSPQLIQQRPALNSWAQGFVNNTVAESITATSTPATASFWNSGPPASVVDGSGNQASTYSSSNNLNRWSDSNSAGDKNQGFDPSL